MRRPRRRDYRGNLLVGKAAHRFSSRAESTARLWLHIQLEAILKAPFKAANKPISTSFHITAVNVCCEDES